MEYNRLGNPFEGRQLALLETLLEERTPFYVRMQVSPLEAQAAYLLNALLRAGHPRCPKYYAFFGSSAAEAVSGALKLVRHNVFARHKTAEKLTAVYDPPGWLRRQFDPLDAGPDAALVPGMLYFDELDAVADAVERRRASSVLLTRAAQTPADGVERILLLCRRRRVFTVLDESSTDLAATGLVSASLALLPDVITLGENLTDCRVPAGCLLMSKALYKVWNRFKTYNIHSNTWGGNSTTMTCVLDFLKTTPACLALPANVARTIAKTSNSHAAASKLFAKYCNPKMTRLMNLSALNKDIIAASGSKLQVRSGRRLVDVIDASGTFGVNLRGHCPADVVESVLRRHDPRRDYWGDLAELLNREAGFPHVFPAVSGATAMETAIRLALLANAPKKTVVSLQMGYSGKTLLPLATTYKARLKGPFQPLYPHVTFIDPVAPDAADALQGYLATNDVAVVVLEAIQGEGGVRPCPERLFECLDKQQARYEYLIAVDEVQTGMYRTGRFLCHEGKLANVDIVAMSKGTSDMVFPVAATLLSEEVYERARARNENAVSLYSQQYRCQVGAQVAMHAIEEGKRLGLAQRAEELGKYFRRKLRDVTEGVEIVKDVRGEGLMVGLELDPQRVPWLIRGSIGGLFAAVCANAPGQPVFVAFTPDKPLLIRYLPPLTITKREIDAICDTSRRCLQYTVRQMLLPIVKEFVRRRFGS